MIPRKRDLTGEFLINGEIWRVRYVRDPETIGTRTWGDCNPETHEIRLLQSLSREEAFDTWIHEILHAFEFAYDFEMDHKTIVRLERPIREFIKENF